MSKHLGLYERDKSPAVNMALIKIDDMEPGELEETGPRYAKMLLAMEV